MRRLAGWFFPRLHVQRQLRLRQLVVPDVMANPVRQRRQALDGVGALGSPSHQGRRAGAVAVAAERADAEKTSQQACALVNPHKAALGGTLPPRTSSPKARTPAPSGRPAPGTATAPGSACWSG